MVLDFCTAILVTQPKAILFPLCSESSVLLSSARVSVQAPLHALTLCYIRWLTVKAPVHQSAPAAPHAKVLPGKVNKLITSAPKVCYEDQTTLSSSLLLRLQSYVEWIYRRVFCFFKCSFVQIGVCRSDDWGMLFHLRSLIGCFEMTPAI